MNPARYPPEVPLFVVPIGGKYARWACPCGRAALWKITAGCGWCDCGLTLQSASTLRPAFNTATGAAWVRAHVDSLPTTEGTL